MATPTVFVSALLCLIPLITYGAYVTKDRCTFYQNGCAYHVVLAGSKCNEVEFVQGDDPMAGGGGQTILVDKAEAEAGTYGSVKDAKVLAELEEKHSKENMKRLDGLEKSLTKMMEGLSIRSLRHMRHIKSELRQVTENINTLQERQRRKKGMGCPPNFISVGESNSCYRFSNFNATWHQAREYCSAFGANLVALETMKENYILDYLIKSNPSYQIPKAWWTAGNYIVRNRKWMWTSKHHLKPIDFARWAPKEPNARTTMHCMMLYKISQYMWHDAMCTDKHHFICEIELF